MSNTVYNYSKRRRPVKPGVKEKDFIKRNQQLMRKREIDALVERTRQEIVDKYIDLEF